MNGEQLVWPIASTLLVLLALFYFILMISYPISPCFTAQFTHMIIMTWIKIFRRGKGRESILLY